MSSSDTRGIKSNSHRNSRKLGYLERIVLEFAGLHTYVQAAQVRNYAKEKYGIDLDNRRIHDAIKRLENRKVLTRIAHGKYAINSNAKEFKEIHLGVSLDREFGGGGRRVRRSGCNRVRVHGYASSLREFIRKLYLAYRYLRCLISYIRSVLGHRFRKFVGDVRASCRDIEFGVHGVRGFHFKELKDYRFVQSLGLAPMEFGFDIIGDVEKFFVKIYSTSL